MAGAECMFVITSSVHSQVYSCFPAEMRVQQTIATLHCVRERVPDATLVLAEGSTFDWEATRSMLPEGVRVFPCNTQGRDKSAGECYLLYEFLESKVCSEIVATKNIQKVIKCSGRYLLNTSFDLACHLQSPLVVAKQLPSWMNAKKVLTNTVLYSFSVDKISYVAARLRCAEANHLARNIDIEHAIFEDEPPGLFQNLETVGVEGYIASNGQWFQC